MKKMRFLAIAMASLLTFGLVSCGEPENEDNYQTINLSATTFLEIETQVHDQNAAYPVHFKMTLDGGKLVVEGLDSRASETGLANGLSDYSLFHSTAKIADFGKVGGIAKIDEYPEATTFGHEALAVEKHGYVIEVHGSENVNGYENPNLHDPSNLYIRLWLEEPTADGFKVKYEFPFVPVED